MINGKNNMKIYKIILLDSNEELIRLLKDETVMIIQPTDSYDEVISSIKTEAYDVAIINPDMCQGKTETLVKALLNRRLPSLMMIERYDDVENVIDALSAGAFDYFMHPILKATTETEKKKFIAEIVEKISLAADSKSKIRRMEKIRDIMFSENYSFDVSKSVKKIIVIGSSTGGPQSLEQVIPHMPKEILCPMIVVQHMPEIFTQKLAERLNAVSNLKVKEAEDGEILEDGVCYIAKGDYHLEIKRRGEKGDCVIDLTKKEKILGVRPCINITMESAAKIYGNKVVGVILTGMGKDGMVGCKKIKQKGGIVIVESEKTSIIFGMPKSVIGSGYYDSIVDLQKIPVAILQALEM